MTQTISDKDLAVMVATKGDWDTEVADEVALNLRDARADLAALRTKLDKVCEAGEYLLDANRTVNIYANDEWRTRRGALEAAIAAARAGGGE